MTLRHDEIKAVTHHHLVAFILYDEYTQQTISQHYYDSIMVQFEVRKWSNCKSSDLIVFIIRWFALEYMNFHFKLKGVIMWRLIWTFMSQTHLKHVSHRIISLKCQPQVFNHFPEQGQPSRICFNVMPWHHPQHISIPLNVCRTCNLFSATSRCGLLHKLSFLNMWLMWPGDGV